MFKDELFTFDELTSTEVCVQLRSMLSEMEERLLDKSSLPFDKYREQMRLSALKIAFDHYREMMLEERRKDKENGNGNV